MTKQYFEFKDLSSSKFWEIEEKGTKVTLRYGKIGVEGQTTLKTFKTPKEAKSYVEKSIKEKLNKGYKRKGDEGQDEDLKSTKQYFEYKDASSNKFWEIEDQGTKVLLRYGKIGTEGQTTLKKFKTFKEAQSYIEASIKEKKNKGYKKKNDQASQCKILTVELAKQFVRSKEPLELNSFTELDEEAAKVLAKYKGDLSLNGLSSLSNNTAAALAKFEGTLYLNGLKILNEKIALSLFKNKEIKIHLMGLEAISDKVINYFEKYIAGNESIFFDDDWFCCLSNKAAEQFGVERSKLLKKLCLI